jgi:hypothetical protein
MYRWMRRAAITAATATGLILIFETAAHAGLTMTNHAEPVRRI